MLHLDTITFLKLSCHSAHKFGLYPSVKWLAVFVLAYDYGLTRYGRHSSIREDISEKLFNRRSLKQSYTAFLFSFGYLRAVIEPSSHQSAFGALEFRRNGSRELFQVTECSIVSYPILRCRCRLPSFRLVNARLTNRPATTFVQTPRTDTMAIGRSERFPEQKADDRSHAPTKRLVRRVRWKTDGTTSHTSGRSLVSNFNIRETRKNSTRYYRRMSQREPW